MLVGSETPRLFTPPLSVLTPETTRGFEVIDFAETILELTLMPWQRWWLIHALELAEDGTFRFRTVLLLVARQSGKSLLAQVLALWRIYVDRAGLVIGTAQNLSMAEETWDGAVSIAEGIPDLSAELEHVSRVNGDKFLRLTGGERYKVTAASRRAGRGLSTDLVLLDELREHQDWAAWSAVSKTTMARPSPQIVGFSNAGDSRSVVLSSLRDSALASIDDPATSLGIFEWSAEPGTPTDDRSGWQAANPALGHKITEAAIMAALATDPESVFRTEVLCEWVAEVVTAFSMPVWGSLADPDAERGTPVTFALDVAPDQSSATIAVAWKRSDGASHVVLADHRAGVDWAAARAVELVKEWHGRLIVEQTGTAAFLLAALSGITVETVARRFYADACSTLDAAVAARQIRHGNQAELTDAVTVARWITTGDTAQRVISRRDPRVSPLVAASMALHGLTIAPKRKPGRLIIV